MMKPIRKNWAIRCFHRKWVIVVAPRTISTIVRISTIDSLYNSLVTAIDKVI